MTNPRELLNDYDVNPKKSLGQNFLHDPSVLRKIGEIAELQAGRTVLEIGTGTGALTHILAEHAARVITVEVDERLLPILEDEFESVDNVEIYLMDFLDADIASLVGGGPYQVVANLPYYITSAILRKILEASPKPDSVTVTVQKEVADRIIAQPGNMGILSVSVQFYGKPEIAMRINPAVFFPRPDVESAVVQIDVYPTPPVDVPDEASFFRVVRAGFSQKRKQLKNSLASGLRISNQEAVSNLERAGIDVKRRAETLSLEEWAALTRACAQELS